ncbi:MAG: discoidin domain-containing protein [Verrucomicrobia bacterium]|nr:discoidin domain-containing protein [Verrucomicrobiota bacterium]
MKSRLPLVIGLASLMAASGAPAQQAPPAVPVVVTATAPAVERAVAGELASFLGRLYPRSRFSVQSTLPDGGPCILLGSAASDPQIRQRFQPPLTNAESFIVTNFVDGARQCGVVAGADSRGVAHGVSALLTRLGCGFFLSGDTLPPARSEPVSFAEWTLADRPLVRDRLVFDWHNFLSGCSTWNLPEWRKWILQSQKAGFNAIMVHAYGNNPMVSFEFNGQTKPVGCLSTTVKGRDWSTMHVNDVRRLWGGEVFDQPAFGADAALGPDEQRADAALRLMHDGFACAAERAMGVFFANDVDTLSANPQGLILTLPAEARFPIGVQAMQWMNQEGGRMWLANPETSEGYRYYKAQVASLLKAYPQITCLVVWFRTGGTPWMEVKLAEMPAAWQTEYQAELAKTPEAAKLWHAPQVFALGKIVRAFDRALRELKAERVRLAAGTWDFKFLAPCDRFFPPHVKLIGLDYNVLHDRPQLGDAESRRVIREVAAHREVVPVVWAHHDDGNYIGRPYTPFAEFHSKLADARAAGFGIIHWTTRPLDLFFTSLSEQTWASTQDRPMRATCDDMAERCFGVGARAPMGEYLERWVTDAPKFARETSDWFIDHPLTNVEQVVRGCGERLKLIQAVESAQLKPDQRAHLDYFKGLEEFIAAFFREHDVYQRSQALLKSGDVAGARRAMAACEPGKIIQQFARFSSLGGMTRGEQGLVVSMNLRWLTHLVRHRQALGLEAVRVNFAPTSHDKLAQSRGTFTFHFTPDRQVWECRGEEETGVKTFALPASEKLSQGAELPSSWGEIGRTGIESDKPISFTLRPIMARDSRGTGGAAGLAAGDYRLRLLFLDPASTAPDQRVMELSANAGAGADEYEFDPVPARFLRLLCHGNSENDWNSLVEARVDSLATDGGQPAVTASASVDGFPASHAADGNLATRWAARGTNQWLQFRLAPDTVARRVGLEWFASAQRQSRFEVLVSQDGRAWTAVKNLRRSSSASRVEDRVDVFHAAGRPNKLIERAYRLSVPRGGAVNVKLTPERGAALICGAVLEPVALGKP